MLGLYLRDWIAPKKKSRHVLTIGFPLNKSKNKQVTGIKAHQKQCNHLPSVVASSVCVCVFLDKIAFHIGFGRTILATTVSRI